MKNEENVHVYKEVWMKEPYIGQFTYDHMIFLTKNSYNYKQSYIKNMFT